MQLQGKAELIDVRVAFAYSLIPQVLIIPMYLYFILSNPSEPLSGSHLSVINIVEITAWILSIYILVHGLKLYNQYTWRKAFLTSSPIWILSAFVYLYQLYSYLLQ